MPQQRIRRPIATRGSGVRCLRIWSAACVITFALGSAAKSQNLTVDDPKTSTDVQHVVSLVLARREAIFAARFDMVWCSGQTVPGSDEMKLAPPCSGALAFSADEWSFQYANGSGVGRSACVAGVSFSIVPTLDDDPDEVDYSLKVTEASVFGAMPRDFQPRHVGTIWDDAMAKYLKQHIARVELLGSHENQGATTLQLQVGVPKEDAVSAFGVLNPRVYNGGSIYFEVVPKWGYVVPLIEFRSLSGKAGCRIESQQFSEYGGEYLPHKSVRRWMSNVGPGSCFTIDLVAVKDVNNEIASADLAFSVPENTRVVDQRHPGLVSKYILSELRDIQDMVKPELAPPQAGGGRQRIILLFAGGSVLIAIGIVICRMQKKAV